MIRFACPECDKSLSVPDENAGKIGICPKCKCRFRIPVAPAEPDEQISESVPSRPTQTRRDVEDIMEASERRQSDFDDDDDEPENRPIRKKKRKKKRRRSSESTKVFGAIDPFLLGMIGVAVFSLLTLIPAFIWPAAAIIPIALGNIIGLGGGIWFLVVAFMDDTMSGILCLCVPCYSIVYLIQNVEETWRPFALQVFGIVLELVAVGIANIHH